MSNDPLALSGITAGLPQEAEYDAVYAAVTATERGRWFLTQYASRNRNADTDSLVAAIARIEAAVRGDAVSQSGAVSERDLAAIAVEIERIGAAIGTERMHAPDIAVAAERILDITFELRERAVKTTLCDALDAAVREISDACSTGRANGNGAHDAAQMLHDLAQRVDGLIALSREGANLKPAAGEVSDQTPDAATAKSDADAAAGPVEAVSATISQREGASDPGSVEIFSAPAGPFELELLQDDKKFAEAAAALTASLAALAGESRAAAQELTPNESTQNESPQIEPPQDESTQNESTQNEPPQSEASATAIRPQQDAVTLEPPAAEPEPLCPSSSFIEAPDFLFETPKQTTNSGDAELPNESGQGHPLLPGPQLLPGPEDDPAELFEPMPQAGPAAVQAATSQTAAPTEPGPPQLRIASSATPRPAQRQANNPLTALRALSEDELIALFG
jgi:hypothetical protein